VLDPKTPPTTVSADCSQWIFRKKAFRSWWVIGKSTLQLVDFPDEQVAVGEFLLGEIVYV